MLNSKVSAAAAAAAAATDHHTTQNSAHPYSTSSTSDADSDLPSISDQPGFPTRSTRLMQTLPYAPSPIHQSSQAELQQPVHMLASSNDTQRTGYENGYAHAPTHPEDQQPAGQPLSSGASGAGEAVKAFACGTCGKGFARRSDLARHGRLVLPDIFAWSNSRNRRTHTHWRAASRVRSSRLRKAIHPTFRIDSPCSRSYRREATYVRTMRKGKIQSKAGYFALAK